MTNCEGFLYLTIPAGRCRLIASASGWCQRRILCNCTTTGDWFCLEKTSHLPWPLNLPKSVVNSWIKWCDWVPIQEQLKCLVNFLYLIVQLLFDLCASGGVFCNILVSYELQFNFLNLSVGFATDPGKNQNAVPFITLKNVFYSNSHSRNSFDLNSNSNMGLFHHFKCT